MASKGLARVWFQKEELPLATRMLWTLPQLEPGRAVRSELMAAKMNNDLQEEVETSVR